MKLQAQPLKRHYQPAFTGTYLMSDVFEILEVVDGNYRGELCFIKWLVIHGNNSKARMLVGKPVADINEHVGQKLMADGRVVAFTQCKTDFRLTNLVGHSSCGITDQVICLVSDFDETVARYTKLAQNQLSE